MAKLFNHGLDPFCSRLSKKMAECNHLDFGTWARSSESATASGPADRLQGCRTILYSLQISRTSSYRSNRQLVVGTHPPSQEAAPSAYNTADPGNLAQKCSTVESATPQGTIIIAHMLFPVKLDSVYLPFRFQSHDFPLVCQLPLDNRLHRSAHTNCSSDEASGRLPDAVTSI